MVPYEVRVKGHWLIHSHSRTSVVFQSNFHHLKAASNTEDCSQFCCGTFVHICNFYIKFLLR
jgi:hypothetical protein